MKKTSYLARCAMIAAAYAVLTLAFPALSYGPIQLRVSEALCILPFFMKEGVVGLTVGCLLANIVGVSFGVTLPWDVVIGTAATLIAALVTRKTRIKWLVPLPTVISNAVLVGAMLTYIILPDGEAVPLWYNILTVGIGELIVCYGLGIPFFVLMKKMRRKRDEG
ncbi:MAG: QueT transporter family protein [Oscillospiraceae bacterium]|nr:QueT transporter family protein [Oscillospiraceae bacterium]MBQ4545265.1 QueT transporter family protein [Oscillospiraceae bacterium]